MNRGRNLYHFGEFWQLVALTARALTLRRMLRQAGFSRQARAWGLHGDDYAEEVVDDEDEG